MNCVDYFFENSASLEKDFILSGRENVSITELHGKVNRLTAWLRKNAGQDKKIILLSPNSSFFIIAYLAIMRSGNVVVPLNPAIEKEGFEYIAEQIETDLAFVSSIVGRRLKPEVKAIVDENGLDEILEQNNIGEVKRNYDYYNDGARERNFYLQTNTNGLRHTYDGVHPFSSDNLYIRVYGSS